MTSLFVAGGTGFIGRRLVDLAIDAGANLNVLVRAGEAAERLAARGARPIMGDLLEPGDWQEVAASSELAIYAAAPPTWGRRLSKRLAQKYQEGMTAMTDAFFRSLEPGRIQRAVYVAGASYYGDTGNVPAVEEQAPRPKGTGPYLAPAVDVARTHGARGIPAVITFPGAVYGPESWLPQLILEPLHSRKTIPFVRGHDPAISVVHVDDCARAVLHLLQHGQPHQSYFIADDQPVTLGDIVALASAETGIKPKTRGFPTWLSKLVIGPILTDAATGNVVVSNAKLKGTGFTLAYPTMSDGIAPVIASWRELRRDGRTPAD
jgi:nucleoside-diphosphate-sugar epimerase